MAPKSSCFWGAIVGRPVNQWAWVWRKSRLKLIQNKKNDLIWLLVHKAVTVRYALKVWGYISNDRCAVCNRIETIVHCFLECPRVVKLWDHFSPLLSILLNSPVCPSPETVFYPFSSAQSSTGTSLSQYLLATIIYWCWFARNRVTFRNSILTCNKIISLVKRDIQLRIRCDRPISICNFWSFKNVFCSVCSDGDLPFFPLL